MVAHFSEYSTSPQWKVWFLHAAGTHHDHSGGMMFDKHDAYPHRQGAAIFYGVVGGSDNAHQRRQLVSCVHELAHCFNLPHSRDKVQTIPPLTRRPQTSSWMNPPVPAAEATFWPNFAFQFDDEELRFLRHAYLQEEIMGGANFIEARPSRSGQRLEIAVAAGPRLWLGQPVVLELTLYADLPGESLVYPFLHPKMGFVEVQIARPDKPRSTYRPLTIHCLVGPPIILAGPGGVLHHSAYIGYGKDGFYFAQPDEYEIQAALTLPDGSRVISRSITIEVQPPQTPEDAAVAHLFLGDEQGTLLYLLGSDSDTLRDGNKALQQVLDDYATHPLAVYATLVKGYNAARTFKTILPPDPQLSRAGRAEEAQPLKVRPAQLRLANELITRIMDVDGKPPLLDIFTVYQAIEHLVTAQRLNNDPQQAQRTLARFDAYLQRQPLSDPVRRFMLDQVATLRAGPPPATE